MANPASWWRRLPAGRKRFRYVKADGSPLTAPAALARIRALVIPPAWRDVHIAPDPHRRVQAWGWDAAGRKQYRYSGAHVERRHRRRWQRVLRYARVLPTLRALTDADLARRALDRRKVLATVVRLMSRAYFRAGSERYAVRNRTFGICTLRKSHLSVAGHTLVFSYRGKRRKYQRQVVADTPLVEIIEEILALRGRRLFQYPDGDGRLRAVTAQSVNQYLYELLAERYTSKDLRTFGGTVRAATVLSDLGPAGAAAEARRNVVLCCRLVATELGNTPAVCRSAYIHPVVLAEYERHGRTIEPLMRRAPRVVRAHEPARYYPEEAALVRFLERYA